VSNERVIVPGLADPKGLYAHAVRAGDVCVTSGMLGLDASGKLVTGGVAAQAEQALANMIAALGSAGFAPGDLLLVQVLLASIDDWPAFNVVWSRVLEPHGVPARIAHQAAALPLGALVEVQGTAVRAA
jgi:2-iminobutanoate/2-iminopropanoate deaminase